MFRVLSSRSKLYSILTDIAHILAGFIVGYIAVGNLALSLFYTALYIIYQTIEHIIVEEDDYVGDLREYIIGYTIGLTCAIIYYYI